MTQQNALADYYAALERLATGKPKIVTKGSRITNDAVALEAGRGKGSIKKSRPVFADLITAIDEAAIQKAVPKNAEKAHLEKAKADALQYRKERDTALAREVSLLHEVYDLKKKLAKLTGAKVLPLRSSKQK